MKSIKFKFSHSLWGTAALVAVEWVLLQWLSGTAGEALICLVAIAGSIATLYVSTEIVEEIRGARHILALLAGLVAQFVIFFAFQYWFLITLDPASFPTLLVDPVNLVLNSTMVFVFNPIYQPMSAAGRALLLVDTLGSLGLVLFILQNVWQFRRA